MESIHNNLASRLEHAYAAPSNFRPSTGGHMSYHRYFFDDAHGTTYFTKAHDPEFFDENWREAEMRGFLDKEDRLYRHLKAEKYQHIPDHHSYHDDVLVLNGLLDSDGWYWRAPEDTALLHEYTSDVISALQSLESIPVPVRSPQDEVAIDVFYNHGWDKLHDIDIPQLVKAGIDKWGNKLHDQTIISARFLLQNIESLRIKRVDVGSSVLNHHDARQANIAWHPTKGTAIVDWSWTDTGLPNGDTTMFLLDLHKAGNPIQQYMDSFNPAYAKMILGYWLQRSRTAHTEGNQIVRMQQFLSAIKASELLLQST